MRIRVLSSRRCDGAVRGVSEELRVRGYDVSVWIDESYQSLRGDAAYQSTIKGVREAESLVVIGRVGLDTAAVIGYALALGKPVCAVGKAGERMTLMSIGMDYRPNLRAAVDHLEFCVGQGGRE